ncbi:MAG: hypothetical protein OD918_01820 [Gammaproteobacteria bacterium]
MNMNMSMSVRMNMSMNLLPGIARVLLFGGGIGALAARGRSASAGIYVPLTHLGATPGAALLLHWPRRQ